MKEGEYMKGFYTVSQYAAIFGKDSGNIRRMLINGTLEGEKVGKQWLIPKTAKLAEDRRLKSGKYRNWRNKIRINNKHPQILKQLSDMCKKIGEIYEDVIDNIVLNINDDLMLLILSQKSRENIVNKRILEVLNL